ncbi:hypothetical protein U9M48_002486 [Paspalum notatum var. saurae]|uniref:Uncharacterized protein n=1 Tax=Paspalum notatum var. saurae TaxID=547442 RepID=A0AAQ3SHH6_PASNO
MAAATNPASSSPFHFLKEGLLLPNQNRRLFAAVFAITVISTALFLVASELGVEPLALEVRNAVIALRSTRPQSPDYARLIREIQDGTRDLLLTTAAYHVSAVVAGSTVRLVALFAAVTTYSSGEAHGFSALLGKASRAQLKGAVRALAFVCALEIACVALLLALAALFVFLAFKRYSGLRAYVYLSFVCSLGLAVAVAEPAESHGSAGAVVGRAWRMMKGRRRRAVLLIALTAVLGAVFRPVYWLARVFVLRSMAMEALLLGALYTFLMAGVELFFACALAAFYYESKGRAQAAQELATQYVKLSI